MASMKRKCKYLKHGHSNDLSEMGKYLKQLRTKMLEAEAEYERCKKEYEYYAGTILPVEMLNAGVTDIKLTGSIHYKYKCPNCGHGIDIYVDRKEGYVWLAPEGEISMYHWGEGDCY